MAVHETDAIDGRVFTDAPRQVLIVVPGFGHQDAKDAKAKEKAAKVAAAKLRKQEMAAKTAAGPSKKKQEKQAASEAKQVCDCTRRFLTANSGA